ncbi:MAG: type II secretion system F family protein [Fusicatenibacter sp.]|nr:type II secretion system F family protein [Fusicatenibacter sp.]
MIWIHLIAGVGLLIWFVRMRKKTENHKLVRRIFCLAATGNLLGAVLTVGTLTGTAKETEPFLERGALGSQPAEEELEVSIDHGEPYRITVTVPPKRYSQEEVIQALNAAIETLDAIIPGENDSLLSVNRNLELVTELPDSPVTVSWDTDQPLLIDDRGMLSDQIPEEGAKVKLEGHLRLQGEERIYERTVYVYPPQKGEDEEIRSQILKAIEKENEGREEEAIFYLPTTLNGRELQWSEMPDYTGMEVFGLALVAGIFYGFSYYQSEERKRREQEQQMMRDYPEIVSKIVLLLGAGLGMRKVFERIAYDYRKQMEGKSPKEKRYGYEEILLTYQEMENGISEQEAYERMGKRCPVSAYRSLASLLTQNLKKGSKGLLELLKQESQEALENRRRQAREAGEIAATRLLLPMGMMLVVVLIILTVPAFLSFYA